MAHTNRPSADATGAVSPSLMNWTDAVRSGDATGWLAASMNENRKRFSPTTVWLEIATGNRRVAALALGAALCVPPPHATTTATTAVRSSERTARRGDMGCTPGG